MTYNLTIALFGLLLIGILVPRRTGAFRLQLIVLAITVFCSNIWYTGGWIVNILLLAITRNPLQHFNAIALIAGTVFSFLFIAMLCLFLENLG